MMFDFWGCIAEQMMSCDEPKYKIVNEMFVNVEYY